VGLGKEKQDPGLLRQTDIQVAGPSFFDFLIFIRNHLQWKYRTNSPLAIIEWKIDDIKIARSVPDLTFLW
jgi:hypothetical protein